MTWIRQLEVEKMEDEGQVENDRQRAEVFDALGHPTRIVILKALSEGALGFAELKKKTAIESSGHLQHHLNKLNGLIKTDEYGKYCLTEQGKDALLTVQTVENSSPRTATKEKGHRHLKVGLKPVAVLLVALLIASSAVAVYEYNQAADFQREFTRSNSVNLQAMEYYSEFGIIPNTNVNSSYTPPISMYRALQLGLESDGWNKTSLYGLTVGVFLDLQTTTNQTFSIGPLTSIPSDYSDVYGNGITYRYVWQITVTNSSVIELPPPGYSLIDASTGQILPNPPLY